MQPHYEILDSGQKEIWAKLGVIPSFTLYGGIALGLRLGHRKSLDLDFFSSKPFDAKELEDSLPFKTRPTQVGPNTLSVVEEETKVKLSFFGGLSLAQVKAPDIVDQIRIASLEDIYAAKLRVITVRSQSRDFNDIEQIIRSGKSLAYGLGCCRAVYGNDFNTNLPLLALGYYGDAELKKFSKETQRFLIKCAREVGPIPFVEKAFDRISSD